MNHPDMDELVDFCHGKLAEAEAKKIATTCFLLETFAGLGSVTQMEMGQRVQAIVLRVASQLWF